VEPNNERIYKALTARESECLKVMLAGHLTMEAMSESMNISADTVKRHFSNIFEKTGFESKLQIAMYLIDNADLVEAIRVGSYCHECGRLTASDACTAKDARPRRRVFPVSHLPGRCGSQRRGRSRYQR
jgi:DNA-binding CsgD family transcriptional regulator